VRSSRETLLSKANEPTRRERHLSVKLSPDMYKALAEMAMEHERSIAGEIRWVIRQLAEEAGLM
jgi:hypothetical protein